VPPIGILSGADVEQPNGGRMPPESYSIRHAKPEEQRQLTRLCVRATLHTGYDESFIDRVMPALTITLPSISTGCVQVAQRKCGEIVGVVVVTLSTLQGIALLEGIFVDPPFWRHGIGRTLFKAAVTRTKALKAGALMIYAEPSAEGFYKRMGAIRIGEGPFFYSPEIILPHLLYLIPHDDMRR
jgi:GNAT superfamily N-acetyltransferase